MKKTPPRKNLEKLAASLGRPHHRRQFLVSSAVVLGGAACTTGATAEDGERDSGPGGTGGGDGGVAQGTDGGGMDAGPGDAGTQDAGAPDAGAQDAGPVPSPADITESTLFPQGVASGDVTPTSAVLWTLFNGVRDLRVLVWRMEDDTYAQLVADEPATPEDGGFVHVDVGGLQSWKRYRYAFVEVENGQRVARSPVGRFRAALDGNAMEPLVIGACACTSNGRAMDTLERAGERDDIATFLLLGDTTYNDGSQSMTSFRRKWAENFTTDGYRALRAATSILPTWDDHEVDNDWTPENIDLTTFTNARKAFFEHLPIRRNTTDPGRIWRSRKWGATAEIFVLDCRGERKPSTRTSGNAEYLSTEQFEWLKEGLRNSSAVFKIIANSVPIGNFPLAFDVAARDRWEGYASQRTAILRFIDEEPITGVIWMSGDFHLASVGRVSSGDNPGAEQIEILAGPGAQSGNILSASLRPPQWDWASGENNYTTLELDPVMRTFRVQHINGNGRAISDRSFTV